VAGFFGRFGEDAERYEPAPTAILVASPKPGTFYRPRKGIYPVKVADIAYGAKDRKKGLLLMNAATWNGHVHKAKTGWEAYKVQGLQFEPRYAPQPARATFGSGTAYPVVWIPPLDGREPEAVFSSSPPAPPLPGGDPATWAPKPKEPAPPTPPDVPPPQSTIPGGGTSGAYSAPTDYGRRYEPQPFAVKTSAPKPGTFYRPRKGIYPVKVADIAYGAKDRKKGLLLMNAATWNDHVRRARKGWEAYKRDGLQFDPKYGTKPIRSLYRSGTAYPVIWVPPLDGKEPEQFFAQPQPKPPEPPPYVPPDVPPPQPPPTPPPQPPQPPPYVPPDVPPPQPPTPPPDVPPPQPPEPPPQPPAPVPPDVPPPQPPTPPPDVPPPTPPPDVPPPTPPTPPPDVPPTPEKKSGGSVSTGLLMIALSMAAKAFSGDR
jgi:hypothetical protein